MDHAGIPYNPIRAHISRSRSVSREWDAILQETTHPTALCVKRCHSMHHPRILQELHMNILISGSNNACPINSGFPWEMEVRRMAREIPQRGHNLVTLVTICFTWSFFQNKMQFQCFPMMECSLRKIQNKNTLPNQINSSPAAWSWTSWCGGHGRLIKKQLPLVTKVNWWETNEFNRGRFLFVFFPHTLIPGHQNTIIEMCRTFLLWPRVNKTNEQ